LDKIAAAPAAENAFGAIAEEHLKKLGENGAALATLKKVRIGNRASHRSKIDRPMSVGGQERRFGRHGRMSAIPPIITW
jgi:hypothetical protein